MDIIGNSCRRIKNWVEAQITTHKAITNAHHTKYTDTESREAIGDIDNPCNIIYIDSGNLGAVGNHKYRIRPDPSYRNWLDFYDLTTGSKAQLSFGVFEVDCFYLNSWSRIHKSGVMAPYWFIWLSSDTGKIILDHISKITFEDDAILKDLKNHAHSALSGTKKLIEIDIGGVPYYFEVYPTKA